MQHPSTTTATTTTTTATATTAASTSRREERLGSMSAWTPVAAFYAGALLLSWLAWLPLALAAMGVWGGDPPQELHLLGSLGPMLSAFIVTAAWHGRPGVTALARRMVAWRGNLRWIALAVLVPLGLYALGVLVTRAVQGVWLDVGTLGQSPEYPWMPAVVAVLANLVFYGYGEEVGWRGFLLPRLQARSSALKSAVLVTLFWACWHIPLFAFADGFRKMGAIGIPGWLFSLLLGSVILTWLFNSSGGSILVVALFHAMLDVAINSPSDGVLMQNVVGGTLTVLGFVLVNRVGREHLARRPRVQETDAAA